MCLAKAGRAKGAQQGPGSPSKSARLGRGAAPRPDEWVGAAPGLLSRIKEGSQAKGRRCCCCCCCCCGAQQRVSFGQPSAAQTRAPPPSCWGGGGLAFPARPASLGRPLSCLLRWPVVPVPRPGHFGSEVIGTGAWTLGFRLSRVSKLPRRLLSFC